ncbi:hypothetical protein Tco_0934938 [Tanacetum coccineum]
MKLAQHYHSTLDREQHSARELFRYREDSNDAAFVVAATEKTYAHELLTFNDTIACEVISKWKVGLKEEMDADARSGRLKKKRKRSKHKDAPFVKDGDNNAKANGSVSRQAQQEKPVVGQDGSGRSGIGAIIGVSDADCTGSAGVGVGSQGSYHTRWTKRRVQTVRISP